MAIVVDDFAEIPQVVRGPHLTSLFLKGRHWGCSTFVSSQGFRLLSPAIRKNAISLLVGRLRTESDVLAIADELGGSLPGGKRQVEEFIKRVTTSARHAFLYVDLSASPERMFHANWEPLSLTAL